MARNKIKPQEQPELFDFFMKCPVEDLETWYNSYLTGYPRAIAPLVRALAVSRGLDVSNWKEFYV